MTLLLSNLSEDRLERGIECREIFFGEVYIEAASFFWHVKTPICRHGAWKKMGSCDSQKCGRYGQADLQIRPLPAPVQLATSVIADRRLGWLRLNTPSSAMDIGIVT